MNVDGELARQLFDSLHDLMLIADVRGAIVCCSQSVCSTTGYTHTELQGTPLGTLFGAECTSNLPVSNLMEMVASHGLVRDWQVKIHRKDGTEARISWQVNALDDAEGKPWAIAAYGRDVTESWAREETSRMIVEAIEQGPVSILLVDIDRRIRYANRTACELYGYTGSEFVGLPIHQLSGEGDGHAFYDGVFDKAEVAGVWRGEDRRRRKDGGLFYSSSSLTKILDRDGKALCYQDASRDNAERVEISRRLQSLSIHDPLTGLYNRRYLDDCLNKEWGRAARQGEPLSVVLIDIDFFKRYNDYYGHLQGDECLRRVARALEGTVHRATDAVARFGGEEFVVVLPNTGAEGATHMAEALRAAVEGLRLPHERSVVNCHVTISLGVASIVPPRNATARNLLLAADQALYRAKENGRNRYELVESAKNFTDIPE